MTRRTVISVLGAIIVLAGLGMVGLTLFVRMSQRHVETHLIDVGSGATRVRVTFKDEVRSDVVTETEFARFVKEHLPTSVTQPQWERTATFRGYSRISPHHSLHGADYTLEELMILFEMDDVPLEERIDLARRMLELLRQHDKFAMSRLLTEVAEKYARTADEQSP